MRRRLAVMTSLVPALLACASCGLLPTAASTTPAASDDVRVWATDPGLTAARAEALRQALAGRPGAGCDVFQEDALERVEFPPPRLRASLAQGGVDRVWIERHRPTCPGPRVNLMAGFRPQPFATPLLPGETLADPLTQADLRLQVRAAAEARGGRPRGCADEPTVLDTSVASPPATQAAATTTWRERWTVGLCGQRRSVDVAFTTREAGAGATTFQITPAPGVAPGRG